MGQVPIHERFFGFDGKLVAKYASPMNPMEYSLKHERLEAGT